MFRKKPITKSQNIHLKKLKCKFMSLFQSYKTSSQTAKEEGLRIQTIQNKTTDSQTSHSLKTQCKVSFKAALSSKIIHTSNKTISPSKISLYLVKSVVKEMIIHLLQPLADRLLTCFQKTVLTIGQRMEELVEEKDLCHQVLAQGL